jgi:hypothetical protein
MMEALNFHFGTGRYTGRDIRVVPRSVLLEPHMPHVDERTRRLLLHGYVRCPEEGENDLRTGA